MSRRRSARFWSAPVLWRFGERARAVSRVCDLSSGWVAQAKAAEDCRTPRCWRAQAGSWPQGASRLWERRLPMNLPLERGQPCPREATHTHSRTRLSALRPGSGARGAHQVRGVLSQLPTRRDCGPRAGVRENSTNRNFVSAPCPQFPRNSVMNQLFCLRSRQTESCSPESACCYAANA